MVKHISVSRKLLPLLFRKCWNRCIFPYKSKSISCVNKDLIQKKRDISIRFLQCVYSFKRKHYTECTCRFSSVLRGHRRLLMLAIIADFSMNSCRCPLIFTWNTDCWESIPCFLVYLNFTPVWFWCVCVFCAFWC